MTPVQTVENRVIFEYALGVTFVAVLFAGFLSGAFPGPHLVDGVGTAVVIAFGPILLSLVFAVIVGLGVDRAVSEGRLRSVRTDERRTQ
jgi:hypothetical protein